MATINYAAREINVKIVYYGPALSGKTTNLQIIHKKTPQESKSDMVSLATEADRTLFFDFLPIDLGKIRGFTTKIQLYTVPGQVYYNATRKLVLRGVDGIVFVADSDPEKMPENIESLNNMEQNLAEYGYSLQSIPVVLQYNKRDLPNALSVEALNEQMNRYNAKWAEAIARSGPGVFETLKLIGKEVIDILNQKYASPVTGQTGQFPTQPMPAAASRPAMAVAQATPQPAAVPQQSQPVQAQTPVPQQFQQVPAPAPAMAPPPPPPVRQPEYEYLASDGVWYAKAALMAAGWTEEHFVSTQSRIKPAPAPAPAPQVMPQQITPLDPAQTYGQTQQIPVQPQAVKVVNDSPFLDIEPSVELAQATPVAPVAASVNPYDAFLDLGPSATPAPVVEPVVTKTTPSSSFDAFLDLGGTPVASVVQEPTPVAAPTPAPTESYNDFLDFGPVTTPSPQSVATPTQGSGSAGEFDFEDMDTPAIALSKSAPMEDFSFESEEEPPAMKVTPTPIATKQTAPSDNQEFLLDIDSITPQTAKSSSATDNQMFFAPTTQGAPIKISGTNKKKPVNPKYKKNFLTSFNDLFNKPL